MMSLSSLGKMTTSESEQSVMDLSMDRSTDSNRATYIFQHLSEDEEQHHHRKSSFIKEASVLRYKDLGICDSPCFDEDDFGEFHNEASDEYHEDVLIDTKIHSFTYSKENIEQLLTKAEKMVSSHSRSSSDKIKEDHCEAISESDDEVTNRLTLLPFQPIVSRKKSKISARKVSMKEVSSIDSDVDKTWQDTRCVVGESRTWEVESFRDDDNNSLGEISSGEMSSHDSEDRRSRLSNVISDLWDEVT